MLTLTAEGCAARRQRLIASTDADVMVINNPRHIFYFTGIFITPLLLSAWGLSSLTIERSGATTLVIPNTLFAQARTGYVDQFVVYEWYDGGNAVHPGGDMFGDGTTALAKHLRGYGAARLGYERGWMPAGFTTGDLIDLNPALMAMRRRKNDDELALIREAIRVTEAGHRAARAFLRPGVTEIEVYNAINSAINQEFGHPVHLMGDFVGGGRVKSGGGFPSTLELRAGDVMILDVFPIVNGYRADFTATVAVTPDVTPTQRRLDDALHEAQAAGAALLKPGVIAGDVYRAVRKPLEARGFAPHFQHHAGHGLGLDHPEAPYFVPQSEEVLVEGDVVTLEPGAYGDDYGARIEHIYRITADGSERLTAHDTRLG